MNDRSTFLRMLNANIFSGVPAKEYCPCENPHCKSLHNNRDAEWFRRVVRANVYSVTSVDADRGDWVLAEEAIIAAALSHYVTDAS